MKLKIFDNPDKSFYAIKDSTSDEYSILEGDVVLHDSDNLSDGELLEWAEENEFFDDADMDDSQIDYEEIRSVIREQENKYPSPSDIPGGRAYLFFENLRLEFPDSVDIELWDGYGPGDSSYEVVVKGLNSLIELQSFLENEGLKINFEI